MANILVLLERIKKYRKLKPGWIKSFGHAIRGLVEMIRKEPHARFHLAATLLVMILGFFLDVDKQDWLILLLCIGAVWAAEAMNTAVERLADRITTEKDEIIRQAKDIAAASVLVISIISAIVGIVIFSSYLI